MRKIKEQWNAYDIHAKDLNNELSDAHKSLQNAVKELIVKTKVSDFYPDGADKNVALEEAATARIKFRNVLACYDEAHRNYTTYLTANRSNFEHCVEWYNNYPKSHDAVEEICEQIIF
jgi:hypothetical protein